MNHESRTVYLNTAIEALLKAEAALNDLALAYELKPDEKASACHPRTGTLSTAVTNGAIVIHTQRLKSDPGGNLLS
ncbi:hypothetical protein ORE89_004675 [Escherichia coli]|nr:hypothetical protein [Salmonella enterica]EHS2204038.1 hypothetical protein [Salmonella enterica subsp. enterica serovar Kentucky]EKD3545798.1 hypothetical protein [Escherichia coli]EKO0860629.1 hypothetical protein [Salmonella enterica subsp. enterica]EHE1685251.1 hypothetical protein [Salmonella enterica]